MGEPAGRRGRVDLAADDGEPEACAGPVVLTATPRWASARAVPLFRVSCVWPSSIETAADAAGAVASNAALAASRVMLRFTGTTSCQGWAAADTGAQPLTVGAERRVGATARPLSRVGITWPSSQPRSQPRRVGLAGRA